MSSSPSNIIASAMNPSSINTDDMCTCLPTCLLPLGQIPDYLSVLQVLPYQIFTTRNNKRNFIYVNSSSPSLHLHHMEMQMRCKWLRWRWRWGLPLLLLNLKLFYEIAVDHRRRRTFCSLHLHISIPGSSLHSLLRRWWWTNAFFLP